MPELVMTDGKGYKSVAYANVVPVLVEAVKTQQQQIESLKKANTDGARRMETLERENAGLKAELESIKAAVRQLQERQNKQ